LGFQHDPYIWDNAVNRPALVTVDQTPMNVLSIDNVSKKYREAPLFEGVTLGVEADEKVGLIGINGSGKSTLLKIIAGIIQPDTGRVALTRECQVAYLPQNPQFDPDQTVIDAVFAGGNRTMRILGDYEAACHALTETGGHDGRLLERVAVLSHELEAIDGWALENDARTILTQLGIDDVAIKMGTVSGGQAKRVGIAHALMLKPDLLIMDEPTNQLDADTITWLEEYLGRYPGALILVTHDRYFLDRVTTRILEIDRRAVRSFAGSYSYYVSRKEEIEVERANAAQKRETIMRRELAWLQQGARARSTKLKDRVERARQMMSEPVERPAAELDISMGSSRLGKKILEISHISKSYGDQKLIDDFSYTLKPGDRIGVIGPNACGKTTLLDVITGRVLPDAGSIETGQTVVTGYYDQEARDLNEDQRVIDYVREVAEQIDLADGSRINASQMLERFLFPVPVQYDLIARLSGGERRRLYLLRVLMASPNVLLLDEPTNDLDITTLITLEDYLDSFPGCLIVVSHDRYFLDRLVDHLFKFEGGGRIAQYTGNYSEFAEAQRLEAAEARSAGLTGPRARAATGVEQAANRHVISSLGASSGQDGSAPTKDGVRKLSFKEKRELEEVEARIHTAEKKVARIEQQIPLVSSDYVALQALTSELESLKTQLDLDVERWAELAEQANGAS
jgi:ATP-binding cassette subfamily F protein uup